MKKTFWMLVAFCCIASFAFASEVALRVTTDPANAKIERYNEKTHKWEVRRKIGDAPWLLQAQLHEYILLRISAKGYITQEQGYGAENSGITGSNDIKIVLESEETRNSIMLFAIGGRVSSRTNKHIFAGMYKVLTRNLTTYRPNGGQSCEDINIIGNDFGEYSNTLADLTNNRAVMVGDKIFCGVFSYDMKRCLGYQYTMVTEENIEEACLFVDINIP